MSYEFIGQNPRLIFFPILSTIAAVLVLASFVVPLWGTGVLEEWLAFMDEETAAQGGDPMMYVTAFAFYFCNFFVIVFFNTALLACVFDIINGGAGKLSYGVGFAFKRFGQIFGWALLSAVIGVILDDDLTAPGVGSSEAQGEIVGLGAGADEEAHAQWVRQGGGEPLGVLHDVVVEVAGVRVEQGHLA